MTIRQFQLKILRWYKKNRRDMPWRNTYDPYKILVSEVMLQQTQVSRVLPKYGEFIKTFPTLSHLARTPASKLLTTWQGLGYWRRALYLREAAKKILKEHKGKFPHDPEILETLQGVGPYTARAVACFAFQNPEAFIDTNIRRIYLHFFFPEGKKISDKKILKTAQKAVWIPDPRKWHYALFDYGATVLADKNINRRSKHWRKQSEFKNSFRSFRTKTLKFILTESSHKKTRHELEKFLKRELGNAKSSFKPQQIIQALAKDGLIRQLTKTTYTV